MPTDTKKTAPKRSLIGDTRCSICSALGASAMREPMMKAPRALEKPKCVAKKTMPKHRPMDTTTSVSSVIKLCAFLKNVGIKYMPATNHSTKKNTKRPTLSASSVVEIPLVATAIVDKITIIAMPAISSTISTPKTTPVKLFARSCKSSKALMIIAVELIESMPPRKMLSIWLQPKSWPTP